MGEPFKFAREYVAFQAAGLTLKTSKLVFGPKSVVYLGHAISDEGVAVGEDRIKALQELLTPTCIEDLRSVLGVMNFVRRFVPNMLKLPHDSLTTLVRILQLALASRKPGAAHKVLRLPTSNVFWCRLPC